MTETQAAANRPSDGAERFSEVVSKVVDALPGIRVFKDIFRSADKNDDGKLSLHEFKAFFQDSVLNENELEELFVSVDTKETGNVDVEELTDYFLQDFTGYAPIYGDVEQATSNVTKALTSLQGSYWQQSYFDQYRSRFYLRSAADQLSSLTDILRASLESLENESRSSQNRPPADALRQAVQLNDTTGFGSPMQSYRTLSSERRAARRASAARVASDDALFTAPGVADPDLRSQMDRLESLMGDLKSLMPKGCTPNVESFQPGFEDVGDLENDDGEYVYSCDRFQVKDGSFEDFQQHALTYLKACVATPGCYSARVRMADSAVTLFTLWNEEELGGHRMSPTFKDFKGAVSSLLAAPWQTQRMCLGEGSFTTAAPAAPTVITEVSA